mmetsp:Transcript_305/g.953  ORF Transcript_305/g.953 Transcript_305/m.953 type:complete len:134 (+) Transcript_305:325-726(+)
MYLGGYELSEHAAVAYDLASLKLRCSGKGGTEKAKLNFDPSLYREYLQLMAYMDLEELLMSIRRQSAGFSRGSSAYRGVTQHPTGRWEARVGTPGGGHEYLGLFDTEHAAAAAFDAAVVRLRGKKKKAATNFR